MQLSFKLKNKKFLKISLIIIIIIGIGVLFWIFFKNGDNKTSDYNNVPFIEMKILGNTDDLISFSVDPGQEVTGILNVTGSISGGYFFEGNIIINILDQNKKLLRNGNGNAKSDWMTSDPVGFDAVLDFTKLPKGRAYIEIHNDNASGLPENDKNILIPIIIK